MSWTTWTAIFRSRCELAGGYGTGRTARSVWITAGVWSSCCYRWPADTASTATSCSSWWQAGVSTGDSSISLLWPRWVGRPISGTMSATTTDDSDAPRLASADGRKLLNPQPLYWRGRAKRTVRSRPFSIDPWSASMAHSASGRDMSTNPKPLDRPVRRSVMMVVSCTLP